MSVVRAALVESVEFTHDAEAVLSDEGVADGDPRSLVGRLLGAPANERA